MPIAIKYQSEKFSKQKSFEHTYTPIVKLLRTPLNIPNHAYDQEIFEIISSEDLFEISEKITKYNSNYLCEELYKICVSIYHNYDSQYQEEYNTVIHAFQVLSTTCYNEAFPLFISYLSQDKDFVEYFWEDSDDAVVEFAFNFGKNNPDPLLVFIMKEDVLDILKVDVFESLVQLVLHDFLPVEKLKSIYHQLMDKYIRNLNEDSFVPTYLITALVSQAINLNDISLLEKVEPFFQAKKIDTDYFGTYEDHLEELSEWKLQYAINHFPKDLNDYFSGDYLELNQTRPISDDKRILFDTEKVDKFEDFLFRSVNNMLQGKRFDDEVINNNNENEKFYNSKPLSKSTKIGRNDPCPCGSGKKFKKCCINNNILN